MNEREINFTNYFCLSVYTMRLSRFSLEMARSYCASPKLRHTLSVAEKAMDAKIADITLKLKPESRNDILDDLSGEDLQALGSILHEIIQLPSIVDVEDDLINLIKKVKTIQNEKMVGKACQGQAESRNDQELQCTAEEKADDFRWPAIEGGWKAQQGT